MVAAEEQKFPQTLPCATASKDAALEWSSQSSLCHSCQLDGKILSDYFFPCHGFLAAEKLNIIIGVDARPLTGLVLISLPSGSSSIPFSASLKIKKTSFQAWMALRLSEVQTRLVSCWFLWVVSRRFPGVQIHTSDMSSRRTGLLLGRRSREISYQLGLVDSFTERLDLIVHIAPLLRSRQLKPFIFGPE